MTRGCAGKRTAAAAVAADINFYVDFNNFRYLIHGRDEKWNGNK